MYNLIFKMRIFVPNKRFSWPISSLVSALVFIPSFISIFILLAFISSLGPKDYSWGALAAVLVNITIGIILAFTLCSFLGFWLNKDRRITIIFLELLLSWVLMFVGLICLYYFFELYNSLFRPIT